MHERTIVDGSRRGIMTATGLAYPRDQSPWHALTSHTVTAGSGRSATAWDAHTPLYDQCGTARCLAAPGRGWLLSPRRGQAVCRGHGRDAERRRLRHGASGACSAWRRAVATGKQVAATTPARPPLCSQTTPIAPDVPVCSAWRKTRACGGESAVRGLREHVHGVCSGYARKSITSRKWLSDSNGAILTVKKLHLVLQ